MLTRAWVLVLALLGPTSAWAAPLPDYDTCSFVWSALVMYERTTPTGPPRKVGVVTLPPGLTFPCPTAKGTYYYSAAVVGPDGKEAPLITETIGFTIKGGAPLPTLEIGAKAQVAAILLNVRPSPGTTNSPCGLKPKPPCPTVAKGRIGTITGGPALADGVSWWEVAEWGGWVSGGPATPPGPFLVPVPTP